MKIQVESTTKIVHCDGVPTRIWEGATESGIPVVCFIARVCPPIEEDQTEFQRELQECKPPSPEAAAFPPRMIL